MKSRNIVTTQLLLMCAVPHGMLATVVQDLFEIHLPALQPVATLVAIAVAMPLLAQTLESDQRRA